MGQETFYELTRRSIPVSKNDGTYLSWCDSVLSVRTDKGIHYFEFTYNLNCLDKEINVSEFALQSPKTSPAAALCNSKFINSEMKNYDYTEMLVDSSFWPHNKLLTQEMTNVVMALWSPPHFFHNKCVFAILNNIGGVEIIVQQHYKWETLIDLSPYIEDALNHNKSPKAFAELKKSVYIVETSSICWAPQLNADQSCYFVTAQKNGFILFWQIFNNSKTPVIKGKIESGMSEIQNICWIPKTDTRIWLICGDIMGEVNVLEIEIDNDEIKLLQSYILWEHKDRMIASHINYMVIDKIVVVFYGKHRHLVVQALDESKILSQHINNINDYRITDIKSSLDGYFLTTVNVKIFKLNVSLSAGTLNVDLIPVDMKEQFPTYELHSLCFSKTNTLCALGMVDRKLLCRKEVTKIDVVFVSTDTKLDLVIPKILNNPMKKLTDHWDCIEALRFRINKTKSMPDIDYNSLYAEGSNDMFKLKIYLILLILYENKRKRALVGFEFTMPELSVDTVKEKILLLHAQATIDKLYKKHQTHGELNKLEEEMVFGCTSYFEFYSKKHKVVIDIDKDTLSVVEKYNFEYICQSCDDEIKGFTCKSGHLNMYCMLSLTPITSSSYLVCNCCGSTARADLDVDVASLCLFCDQHLINPD